METKATTINLRSIKNMSKKGIGNCNNYVFYMITILLFGFYINSQASEKLATNTNKCKEFQRILKNKEIEKYILPYDIDKNEGSDIFIGIDLDKDGLDDEVIRTCSPSSMPADPCSLTVKNSSTGQEYSFEFPDERFYLIKYKKNVYAISSFDSRIKKPTSGNKRIFTIRASGVKNICNLAN